MPILPPRRITNQVANAVLDTGSLATSLTVGVATTYAAWDTLTPAHWFGDLRIIAAGALCVITAATAENVLGIVLPPLRRSLYSSSPAVTAKVTPPVALTADESLAQIAAAAAADAAHRAANTAYSVDHGQLLNEAERWHGYEDGDAMFYLSPGTVLFFTYVQGRYLHPEFTLLTSKADEQVEIRAISDVHRHLTSGPAPDATAPEAISGVRAVTAEPAIDGPAL